ncbi:MAG: hypothetical protein ACO20H_03650 [Bacteriovoracaceae bacterium]
MLKFYFRQLVSILCIYSLVVPGVLANTYGLSNFLPIASASAENTVNDTVIDSPVEDYQGDKEQIGKTQQGFSWLMILASVALLPTMIVLCSQKVEMGLIIAASLALIIAEVALHAVYKTSSEQEFKIYESKDSDTQKEALKTASDITGHNIKAAYARMAVHFAWGVAMTAAGILAIVSHAKDMALSAASCVAAAAACAASCAPTAGACPRSTTCTSGDTGFQNPLPIKQNPFSNFQLYSKATEHSPTDVHSYLLIDEQNRLQEGAIRSEKYDIAKDLIHNNPAPENKIKELMAQLNKSLDGVKEFILPSAMALDMADFKSDDMWKEIGPMIGLTGAAIIAMISLSVAVAKKAVPLASLNGIARGVLWNSLASFGYISGSLSAVTAVNLKKDKEKYDDLIAKLDELDKNEGNYSSADSYQAINQPLNLNFKKGDDKLDVIRKQLCGQQGKSSKSYFAQSGACKCEGSKCGVKQLEIDYSGGFVPPAISGVAGASTNSFSSAINGDMESASFGFNEMGSYATKVKDSYKRMKELSNKQLLKQGLKGMEHDKMEAATTGAIDQAGRNAINSLPKDQRVALLNYAATSAPKGTQEDIEEATQDINKNNALAEVKKELKAANIKPDEKKKGITFFDFLNEDKKDSKDKSKNNKKASAKDFKNYKIDNQDINKSASKSIFKIIRYRYFKTAYPILLKKR